MAYGFAKKMKENEEFQSYSTCWVYDKLIVFILKIDRKQAGREVAQKRSSKGTQRSKTATIVQLRT